MRVDQSRQHDHFAEIQDFFSGNGGNFVAASNGLNPAALDAYRAVVDGRRADG